MAAYMDTVEMMTEYEGFFDVTPGIQRVVESSGIREGFAILHCMHSTAGLLLYTSWDPYARQDMMEEMDRIVPTRNDFHHVYDTPTDASGHVKSGLVGCNLTLIVHEGKVMITPFQGVFLAEFDGPRKRKIYAKVVSDD